jgi:epsilon-lactone hydrolase
MPSLRSRIIQRIMRDTRDAILGKMPIEVRRRRIDAAARRGIRIPRGISIHPVSAGGVPSEWIEPDEHGSKFVILYLHGGGYVICSPTTHRGLAARIACASEARLLLIDYRLAPEHPYPAALEDALAGWQYLIDQGYEPKQIIIGGDSAGGGLALATTLYLRDHSKELPKALFLLSPWTDLTFSGDSVVARAKRDPLLAFDDDWLVSAYAGKYPLKTPYISPLFSDLMGLPPVYIQVGTEEILYDDSSRLDIKLKAAKVSVRLDVWEGMWHVFQSFSPFVPEADAAIDTIGRFNRQNI